MMWKRDTDPDAILKPVIPTMCTMHAFTRCTCLAWCQCLAVADRVMHIDWAGMWIKILVASHIFLPWM